MRYHRTRPRIAGLAGHDLKDVESIPMIATSDLELGATVKCLKSLVGAPGLEPGTR